MSADGPMDSNRQENSIRFSHSPRRYTHVVNSSASPVRSVHPEQSGSTAQMESIHSQADFGQRTTDFFDDSSEEERDTAVTSPEIDSTRGPPSPRRRKQPPPSAQMLISQCEPKRATLQTGSHDYQRLSSTLADGLPQFDRNTFTSGSASFQGSVDELDILPDGDARSPHFPRPARLPSNDTAGESIRWNPNTNANAFRKFEQRLGMHSVAYEILLKGLLNDEEVMEKEEALEPLASRLSGIRNSMLPQGLQPYDPRSPKDHLFPSAGLEGGNPYTSLPITKKKVSVIPPPIDIEGTRNTLPTNIVRTPYPFTYHHVHRKDFARSGEPPTPSEPSPRDETQQESILTLSVQKPHLNSKTRVTTITIPPSNLSPYTATLSNNTTAGKSPPFPSADDFDDEAFFLHLRHAYRSLTGPWRLVSARSLSRIVISGPMTRAADAGYGWLQQPRSPRVLAYKGLTDTFGEEKILMHYKKPRLGRRRFAFVGWGRRLAAAPENPISSSGLTPSMSSPPGIGSPRRGGDGDGDGDGLLDRELVRRLEQPEGLEFALGWSIRRILLALAIVTALSLAAVFLWTFLGKNTTSAFGRDGAHGGGGYLDAGDRVGTGVLMGICVFLVGMSCFGARLGVSWLVL